MKIVVLAGILLLFSGVAMAGVITRNSSDFLTNCSNPSSGGCNFQVDINGNLTANSVTSNGALAGTSLTATGLFTPQSATKAAIGAITPAQAGQYIFCSNCTNFNAGLGTLCQSTGTAQGAFMAVSSATAVTGCN